MICEQEVPRRNRAFLGCSMALGAFLSTARLLRAFRGFIWRNIVDVDGLVDSWLGVDSFTCGSSLEINYFFNLNR